jgi:hypothetical protein
VQSSDRSIALARTVSVDTNPDMAPGVSVRL